MLLPPPLFLCLFLLGVASNVDLSKKDDVPRFFDDDVILLGVAPNVDLLKKDGVPCVFDGVAISEGDVA